MNRSYLSPATAKLIPLFSRNGVPPSMLGMLGLAIDERRNDTARHDAPPARCSARSLMPRSIWRSMTSEAGSMRNISARAGSVGSRKRLRLIRRVPTALGTSTKDHTQLPSSERQARDTLRFHALDPHPVGSVAEHITDHRMLERRQHVIDAVHVKTEEVLDPVVRVGAAPGRRTHLSDPGPDRLGRRVDVDSSCGDAVGILEQLVAWQPIVGLLRRCSPRQDAVAQPGAVEPAGNHRNGDGPERPQFAEKRGHG